LLGKAKKMTRQHTVPALISSAAYAIDVVDENPFTFFRHTTSHASLFPLLLPIYSCRRGMVSVILI
jgi:hypothetical protein